MNLRFQKYAPNKLDDDQVHLDHWKCVCGGGGMRREEARVPSEQD